MPESAVRDPILEAHMDELRHPDPTGTELLCFLQAVELHIPGEANSVAVYRRLLRHTTDASIRLVMDMLVRDEARHHRLLQQMSNRLREQLTWDESGVSQGSGPPTISPEEVRALEKEERHGAAELRTLAARQRAGDSDLGCLLLESMAMDSEKHAMLLAFVARRLSTLTRR